MVRAGVVNADGRAKYTGLYSLRHFYASWCINRRADGGLELPAKVVQERLGHSSIAMTMNTYGHLFSPAWMTARKWLKPSACCLFVRHKRDMNEWE
jgi:integrase